MKPPKIDVVWKNARRCFINQKGNPQIQDLLYCSLMFMSEAVKASFGHRPQSSSRIALDLIAKRRMRLRLYRRTEPMNVPPARLPLSRRNHRNHV